MQIQQQLHVIDSELTDLELRGRKLEDTIRNGKGVNYQVVFTLSSHLFVEFNWKLVQ